MTQGDGGSLQRVLESGILTVTIANPPDNTLHNGLLDQLRVLCDECESDAVSLIIFTGQGKVFSKGFDLDSLRTIERAGDLRDRLLDANALYNRIAALQKPTVAAINGHCFGGGLELALCCHFRLCAEKARLGLGEVSYGVIPGLGGVHRLARVVGQPKALELIALGDLIGAGDALRMGLVNRVLPRDGFMGGVLSFARALLLVDPEYIRQVIRLVAQSGARDEQENVRDAVDTFVRLAKWVNT